MTTSDEVRVSRITVYPVKSLDGIDAPCATLLASGALAHDRRWAIFDGQGQFVNGKHTPRIHELVSAFHLDQETITIGVRGEPNVQTFSLVHQAAELSHWLSDFFGFEVRLAENREVGFPDDLQASGPTIVSTETLLEVATWFDFSVDQARRRFRANIELAAAWPFWEDQLFGTQNLSVRFHIGDVLLEGSNPCARCVVPARDPGTGVVRPRFAAEFAQRREATLPTWAERSRFDHFYRLAVNTRPVASGGQIYVGDAVVLL